MSSPEILQGQQWVLPPALILSVTAVLAEGLVILRPADLEFSFQVFPVEDKTDFKRGVPSACPFKRVTREMHLAESKDFEARLSKIPKSSYEYKMFEARRHEVPHEGDLLAHREWTVWKKMRRLF